jgi:hypothetical protein
MQLQTCRAQIKKRGYITASDPAAGAGSMPLAMADEIEAMGFDLMHTLAVQAIDISRQTFSMCLCSACLARRAGRAKS